MPMKLIGFIITLLIIITFIGVNLDNSSDIRIWFGEKGLLEEVPIFVSFFVMYLIGVLSVVPFLVSWKMKKRGSKKDSDPNPEDPGENKNKNKKKSVRVLGAGKRRKKEAETEPETESPGKADLS
ncbi:MAG: hypothetical protein KAH21_05740 [Spirochaetaceae bacterium]|nr:hypothetical protein [Spirochaetaceae bacterium]